MKRLSPGTVLPRAPSLDMLVLDFGVNRNKGLLPIIGPLCEKTHCTGNANSEGICHYVAGAFPLQVPGAGEQWPAQRGASSLSHKRPTGPH